MKKYIFVLFLLGLVSLAVKANTSSLLEISIKGNTYFVEVADTPQKAQKGLMYKKSIPQNQGMLFVFPYPSIVQMWMKNTYIPLDMIFMNSQNQVICLHKNALPLDESIISCPYPAQKVLELNAGEIQDKQIQLGDILTLKN